ncbi:MAG: glycosyltransferase family 4 protein [Victivallales bacterium]|nr:glycosyltransferase family 4 protein [Victivallales bacterium]
MQSLLTSIFLFTAYPLWSETFLRQDLAFLQKSGCPIVGTSLYSGDCIPKDDWPKVRVLSSDVPPHSTLTRRRSIVGSMVRKAIPKRLYTSLSLHRHHAQVERLESFVREIGATHIHAEFADLAALVASEVARRLNITYSIGIHAFDIHVSRFDLSDILCNASAITVCNRAALDACKRQFPQTDSLLHYIPHGVNLEFWTLRGEEQSPRIPFRGEEQSLTNALLPLSTDKCIAQSANEKTPKGSNISNPRLSEAKPGGRMHPKDSDLEEVEPTLKENRTSTESLEILFVGRLVEKKGVRILLEALAILQKRQNAPKCRLTIAGDGPLRDELVQYTDELKIPACCWAGVLSQEALKLTMSSMSCLCAPSIVTKDGDRDGIPNVILEAMATGLPVIASLVGSISEVITNDTGWPVADITPQTLAETIIEFANSTEIERKRRVVNARRLIEKSFDAQKLALERRKIFIHQQS